MDKLINLAKLFILQPREAWEEIKNDQSTAQQHITSYVLPLALIPAISLIIGYGLIGYSVFGVRVQSMNLGITQAIISILATVLGVFISGFIIHKLAESFQAEVSFDKAIKLVGFSYTAAMVGGIFNIYLPLAILAMICGIYSLYTLYIGFKPMTNVSEEKNTSYFIVSLIVIIGIYIILGIILTSIFGAVGMGIHHL